MTKEEFKQKVEDLLSDAHVEAAETPDDCSYNWYNGKAAAFEYVLKMLEELEP